jgi:hypothetical protein
MRTDVRASSPMDALVGLALEALLDAEIAAQLVQLHAVAATPEHQRHHGAREAGTHDHEGEGRVVLVRHRGFKVGGV